MSIVLGKPSGSWGLDRDPPKRELAAFMCQQCNPYFNLGMCVSHSTYAYSRTKLFLTNGLNKIQTQGASEMIDFRMRYFFETLSMDIMF